jgi:hypothetical protein
MNKWLLISESHDDLNRCTPYRGKPDQYDTYAFHASPCMPDVRFLWAVPVRDNLSRSRQQITDPLPSRRRALDTIHSMPADRSAGSYLASLPQQSIKQWGKVKLLVTTDY